MTPWIIGFALAGSLLGSPQTLTRPSGETASIWLQNATAIYVPLIVVFGLAAYFMSPLRAGAGELPRAASTSSRRSTASTLTLLYIMTFGSFSGLSATFPLLIKQIYGQLEGARIRWRLRSSDRWSAR